MIRFIVSVAMIVLLAACMLGPDFVSPSATTDVGEEFRVPDNHAQTSKTVSLAEREWREIYRDEQLQLLIEQGLLNNLDLQTARIRLAQSKAARIRARAPLFPKVDLEAIWERERESHLSKPGSSIGEEYILEGVLSWEIDLWGVNRRTLEAADAELSAVRYGLYGQQISIIAAIANTYFDLQNAIDRQEITEATIKSRERALQLLTLRRDGGIISGLDVRQAEVALAQAKVKLPVIVSRKVQLENALQILLGEKPTPVDILEPLDTETLLKEIPVGLPSDLLKRRPDIQVAEAKLHAATASIGIAKGALFPSFTLTAGYGRLSPTLDDLLKSQGKTWIIEGGVLQPLFNAGANLANLEIAKLEKEQVLLSYEKTILTALAEVSDALQEYYSTDEVLLATEQLVFSSQEYLRLALLQYGNGVLSYLDVLDAQRQLFDAELSLSDAKSKKLNAVVQLYKALGGGWQI